MLDFLIPLFIRQNTTSQPQKVKIKTVKIEL